MLRIAICDDSQLWLQKIETLTRGYLKKINVKYRLDLYQSGEKLLKSITSPYDIALLDVDLHSTNGIEVASQLRATNPQIVLIFVSEYVEYAPFGYEVDAIRYLLKNHLEQAFDRVMSEAVKKVREKHLRYAIVTDAGNVMVKFEDILYVLGLQLPFDYDMLLTPVVLTWYIATELGSILENAAEMGAPVPPVLREVLEKVHKASDRKDTTASAGHQDE